MITILKNPARVPRREPLRKRDSFRCHGTLGVSSCHPFFGVVMEQLRWAFRIFHFGFPKRVDIGMSLASLRNGAATTGEHGWWFLVTAACFLMSILSLANYWEPWGKHIDEAQRLRITHSCNPAYLAIWPLPAEPWSIQPIQPRPSWGLGRLVWSRTSWRNSRNWSTSSVAFGLEKPIWATWKYLYLLKGAKTGQPNIPNKHKCSRWLCFPASCSIRVRYAYTYIDIWVQTTKYPCF